MTYPYQLLVNQQDESTCGCQQVHCVISHWPQEHTRTSNIEYNHPLLLKDACVIVAGWFMMHQGQRTDPPWCWSGLVHVPPEMHCAWRLKRVGWPYRMWWLPCGTKHDGIDDQVCGTTGLLCNWCTVDIRNLVVIVPYHAYQIKYHLR